MDFHMLYYNQQVDKARKEIREMTKYNDIEIQTAKNLLEAGYKWIVRETYGGLYSYKDKPHKNYDRNYSDDVWQSDGEYFIVCPIQVPIFKHVTCYDKEPTSLENVVHPQILDDVEKRYLKGVIRPFIGEVDFICKVNCLNGFQRISIGIYDSVDIALPLFKRGTMYKGMEAGHEYTVEELGLRTMK